MNSTPLEIGANTGLYILTAVQTNETFQLIELILSVLVTAVILAYKLWSWFKEAKSDGEITKDEIKKAGEILGEGVGEIVEKVKKGKEQKSKNGENVSDDSKQD